MTRVLEFWRSLGGPKHRQFVALVVSLVLLIGATIVIRHDAWATGGQWYGPISLKKGPPQGTTAPWYKQTVKWCGMRGIFCDDVAHPVKARWEYGENPLWSYNKHWMVRDHGRGKSPHGVRAHWTMVWGAAEFKSCISGICTHTYPYGVRMYVWSDGSFTRVKTTTKPHENASYP